MSNLIITVISIALVAVAALMAVWYGGDAFSSGNAKAQAATLLNAANQIAAAWQTYTADRGGDATITASSNGLNLTLVPAYLAGAIELSGIVQDNQGRPFPIKLLASGVTNATTDSNAFEFNNISQSVCAQANLITQGASTIVTDPGYAVIYQKAGMGYCTYLSSQSKYFFYYRPFP